MTTLKKSTLLMVITLSVISFLALATFLFGQTRDYPARPIELAVGYSPGGGTDTFFRTITDALSKNLKVKVQIINKPGAGGTIGAAFVSNSKPDGYTILGTPLTTISLNPLINPDTPYRLEDFTTIANCAYESGVLAVRKDSGFKSLDQFVSYVRKNPGVLKAGTGGVGTEVHLSLEILKYAAGINIPHVPFGGGAESIAALLGNHVQFLISSASIIKPHVRSGDIVALAVTSAKRVESFPDVPTTAEAGYPQVNITNGKAIMGPKRLLGAIVEKLEAAINSTLKDPEVVANLKKRDYVVDFLGSKELKEMLERDGKFYSEVVEKTGMKETEKK